jgi:hypothetical protein
MEHPVANPNNNNLRPGGSAAQQPAAAPVVQPGAVNANTSNPERQPNARINQRQAVSQPVQLPQRTVAQPSPANRTQLQARPVVNQNNQAKPANQNPQRVKPKPKPNKDENKEKPKPKDAN